jgi:hypothetical protein
MRIDGGLLERGFLRRYAESFDKLIGSGCARAHPDNASRTTPEFRNSGAALLNGVGKHSA